MVIFEPTISLGLIDVSSWQDQVFSMSNHGLVLGHLFAQSVQNVDILADFQKSWKNFIQSGQVWALGIGFVLGYMFRTFTSS
ncbi:conserved hypothetical protein [Rippkaea orientalis PCC 8801]|uniref:Uncharacterized protein n=1 Tax=Rippkaea orientalis (strain PCC 8801 / RF-1) TaxID=41431 RepID=B7K2S2_RIPO1|nr:hypothetical protein [Rippkaea orientalis]ACK67623.1 conserved hypothetical protein [Rippkaea orientalis PCC 8801]